MIKKIVNLICNKCGNLTTIKENVDKMKCYWCGSKNIETGWEASK